LLILRFFPSQTFQRETEHEGKDQTRKTKRKNPHPRGLTEEEEEEEEGPMFHKKMKVMTVGELLACFLGRCALQRSLRRPQHDTTNPFSFTA
jgi:hypothetical protein